MKKKLLSLVLTIVLLLSALPISLPVSAATINETESNDSYASANSFSLNSTISGSMSSSDDKDYFKITPSQNGKISLTFSHNYSSNSDIYWNIVMYAYSSGNYTEFYNQRIYANSGESNKLASIGASSGTTYYIKISTYYNATTGFGYNLKNEFTSTNYYEKEINNDYSSATPVSFNQTYGGVMNDTNDVDYYKFSPTQNGKIALTFTHEQSDNSDIYWNIVMYAYLSGNYTEFYNQRIYANSGESNKLASIGASSETIYYVKIYTYYNATVGFDYNLKNEFTSTNYYEKEINNNYSSATPMSFNQTYGGVMNDDDDVDVFKFSPTQDGKISLTFSHDYSSNSDIYWNIVMYAYSSGNYTEFYNQRINANSGETNKLSPIGVSSNTIYYIKIYTYYNATVAFDYNLKNEFTATDYYEKEINKDYSSATPILLGATYGGVMNDDDDVDIYKITLTGSSTPVSFSHDYANNSDVYWYVKIIDASTYSEIFNTRVNGSDSNGVVTTLTQAGTFYIKISTYYNATTNYEYSILIGNPDTTKPTGSISSTNNLASSQTITLTMSDNIGLAGYYWGTSSSTSPSFTSISGKSYSATVNSFSSNGTYYLTVKDTSGNIYQTSKTFYKTTLNANGGSVTPTSVITMGGNSFTFPTPTKSNNTYKGWSTDSNAASGIYSLTPTGNKTYYTYYATWEPDPSYGITLSKTSLSLTVGNTSTLTATTTPSGQNVTWTSSNTSVATVSTSGLVTAKAQGSATITAKITYNGKTYSDTCNVTVSPSSTNALIKASTAKGTAGKTVDVTISLSNNPGIVAMTLKVTYNTSALTLVNVKDAGVLGSSSHKPEYSSPYTLSWANDTATSNYTVNGTVATLSFEIKDGASVGNYPITVTYDYNNYGIYDKDLNKVTFNIENGAVEVIDVIYGDVDGNGIVNNLDRVYLTRYLANWNDYQNIDLNAADVDNNGTVNNLDRVILTRHLANWSAYSELPYSY